VIVTVSKFATLVAAPVAATFVFRGESFITLWMGAAYGPVSGEVLRILGIAFWLESTRSVVIHSLTGMGKQRAVIPGLALEAAVKIALSIALVGPLGIIGVALGTLIPGMLVNLAYVPRCLSSAAAVPVRVFHRQAQLLPTLACVPFALASVTIERYLPATNLALFFVQVLLILPLVPMTAWFLCLNTAERKQVELAFRRLIGR
jgi:O-antigen/teichoic acid export membrane protein